MLSSLLNAKSLFAALLKKVDLTSLLSMLIGAVTLTDLMGGIATYMKKMYVEKGRSAVIAALTIKTVSIRQWATRTTGDPDKAVAAWGNIAKGFADFIEALLPTKSAE